MKKSILLTILGGALVALNHNTMAAEGAAAQASAPLSRKDSMLVSMNAKVEAIDKATREITLKGPLGNEETFVVDKAVKRFDEINVGDNISADYYISVAAELRKPTPEEEKHPLMYLDAAGRASEKRDPAAGAMTKVKAVTTIEGLDRQAKTVKLKGPMGHYHTVRVQHPENLTKMRIGENIVVVYTEAVAISLEKVEKKKSE
jgi:hypothetical protein